LGTRDSYAPGVFCWVDHCVVEPEPIQRFYSELLGWDWEAQPADGHGYYAMATLEGDVVAGLAGMPEEMQASGAPPMWNSYISVADLASTLAKVDRAGGRVMIAATEVAEQGRLAVIVDPTGAGVSLWEPRQHRGATRVNAPGCWAWNELTTRDVQKAQAFYHEIFGWDYRVDTASGHAYYEILVDGRSQAGMMPMDANWPAEIPAHWMVYFSVADVDAAAAKASELGGGVCVPPTTIHPGRFAVLNDPAGGTFSAIRLNHPDD